MARVGDDLQELGEQLGLAELKSELFGIEAPARRIDRYRVLEELGRGGMGLVLRGLDEQLDRPVALKLLAPEHTHADEQRARLAREARALAQVSHPAVVQIYDVGEFEGATWVAMELVEGRTLRRWLETLPASAQRWRELLPLFIEIGEGLAAAHDAQLVHRDVKPENIMVTERGRARVLDFGLARSPSKRLAPALSTARDTDATRSRSQLDTLTRAGQTPGTPAYMAPEQFEGLQVDARCDQFSFCVMLWEAVYGQRPYASHERHGLSELRQAVCGGELDAPPPTSTSPPRWLEAALRRGLAAAPEQRWPSMGPLLEQLRTRPLRPRKRLRAAGVSLALAGALAVGWSMREPPAPCEVDMSSFAGIWGQAQREQLRAAIRDQAFGDPARASQRVEQRLDAWTAGWIEAQRSSCLATRVQGTQSEELLDLRSTCREHQRAEFAGLVETLARGQSLRACLDGESALLDALPDLRTCAAVEPGDPRFVLHQAPRRRAAVELSREFARARALLDADLLDEVGQLLERLEPSLDTLAHAPASLEHRALAGELELAQRRLDAGAETLLDTTREAEVLGLDELAASIRVELAARLVGAWSKPELEQMLLADADMALRRVARRNDPRAVALLRARGFQRQMYGDFAGALAEHRRALELAEALDLDLAAQLQLHVAGDLIDLGQLDAAEAALQAARVSASTRWGPRSPLVALVEQACAQLELARGRLPRAQAHVDAALGIDVPLFGEHSLRVGRTQLIAAKLAMSRGQLDEARALVEPLVEVFSRALGPRHFDLLHVYNAQGVLRYFAGEYEASLHSYAAALELSERTLGPAHRETALLHSNIGESELALEHHERARSAFDRALRAFESAGIRDDILLALPLKGRGQMALQLGDAEAARRDLEQAHALMQAHGGEPIEAADIALSLARALVASGGELERAQILGRAALTTFRQLEFDERATSTEQWLTTLAKQRDDHDKQ